MAVRNGVITDIEEGSTVKLLTWTGLTFTTLDSGAPAQWCEYADRCVQVTGVFGTGGSVTLEGSNDGVNFTVLADPQGNALTFTVSKLEQALETPRYVRPRVTAGNASTDLVVSICMRKGK